MATQTVYTLGASQISVSGGESLSGMTQGDGHHLLGQTITLNSNNWETVSIEDPDANFQDSSSSQTLSNTMDYDGVTYASGIRVEAEYSLVVQDPDGNSYTLVGFNLNEPGITSYATVEGLAFVGGVAGFPPVGVPLTVVSNQEGPSVPYANLASPPCFVAGSWVETPTGCVRIEDLAVGDLVVTQDRGAQPVRWIGRSRFPKAALLANPKLRPIGIKAGAFGPLCPVRDTMVSPQHRILISGWQAALLFGQDSVLVPAKKLCNDLTITTAYPVQDVEYFHLLFDQHEVISVDGMLSESFLPGPETAGILPVQDEFFSIFGGLPCGVNVGRAVRPLVSDRNTVLLATV